MQSGRDEHLPPLASAAPTAEQEDPARSAQLTVEQVQLAARNVPLALAGLAGNVVVLAYAFWDVDPRARVLAWAGTLLVLIAVRAAVHLWFLPRLAEARWSRRWLPIAYGGALITGVAWGAAGFVFLDAPATQRVFIAFLTGGLSAGSMAAYAPLPWLATAFFLPATLCVSLSFLLLGDSMSVLMAAMVAFFALLLVPMSRDFQRSVLNTLRLRLENRGILGYLSQVKVSAEAMNAELTERVAEREQAQRALRESEERFRSLVENATDGIGFTFEGRIHYANQAALDLIGYTAEEVLGLPIEQFLSVTTRSRDQIFQRYQDRIAGKDVPRQYETQMVRKDGSVLDVMFSNSLVALDGKQGVMSIVKDITERKRAEEELRAAKDTAEEATRLKDQFVSLLAHDLRAPLNSVFSLIAMLDKDPDVALSDEQKRILHAVTEQGEVTLRMIEDLLSVSRLHTGALKPTLRFVDAEGVVATALSLLRPIAAEKKVELLNEVSHHTRLYTDPDMLGKVLYNLLANAIKFCRPGQRVRIYVPERRPTVVAVEDNGPGVEPRLVDDLFRHEVKTSTVGTAGERGTGLGLPLSQDLMRALGGEITLQRTSGQGSVFFAEVPPMRPRVLVVGHNDSLSLFVRPHLESIDAEFLAAANGEEALGLIERENVHLVIAETHLASNGGMVLLQRIRDAPRGRGVSLVLVADSADAGLMEHGFRMGADEIVVKPLVPTDFIARLRRFIA